MQGVALLRHLCHVGATLAADVLRFGATWMRSRTVLAAENLCLRKQLALYQEREIRPRRATDATRLALAVLARVFPWRDALLFVQPATLIHWHRGALTEPNCLSDAHSRLQRGARWRYASERSGDLGADRPSPILRGQ